MKGMSYLGLCEDELHDPRKKATLYLVVSALLWSLGGVFTKLINWNPIAIAGMRSAITALLILIYMKKPKFNWSKVQVIGAISYATTVITFIVANKMTTGANAILLQYTAPIYVALFGTFFVKERTTKVDWLTIGAVFIGMVLFFIGDIDTRSMWGNFWAVVSGISFAGVAITLRMQKDGSPLESVLLGNIVTAIIGIPFMFQSMPTPMSWVGLVLMGTVQLGFPYILYTKAIKSVSALEATLIPVIEPIINPVWTFLIVGEVPGKWAVVGGIVVIGAVTARSLFMVNYIKKHAVKEYR